MKTILKLLLCLFFLAGGCYLTEKADEGLIPPAQQFQQVVDGKSTDLFVLQNASGMKAAITNYGGRLVSLIVPDRRSGPTSVVLGFDSLSGYISSTEPYFGATIGRYANRIAAGRFVLGGKTYQLPLNNGSNTLHGGRQGFQYRVWDATQHGDSVLVLRYSSKDGEEGFPGQLSVKVTYRLTQNNALRLDYEAMTDQKTVVNLTNHAFFNLNGEGNGGIAEHLLRINADRYTPIDSTLIPNGGLESVKGSPFDFTAAAAIGSRLSEKHQQLSYGKGYDHNYVLNARGLDKLAALAIGDRSGIEMRIYTTEPGIQFYGGNFMQSKNQMRMGKDQYRTAFCLETQHFPDSPNRPSFPSTELRPGEVFHSSTIYRFRNREE